MSLSGPPPRGNAVRADSVSGRLVGAKGAYTTRAVVAAVRTRPQDFIVCADAGVIPTPGDVVLARVERIGQHKALELPTSRRATMFVGDELLVAYGNRYAPDQFEAEVPDDLGEVHLVAAGGVAARVLARHSAVNPATQLDPVGIVADAHGIVNLRCYAPLRLHDGAGAPRRQPAPPVIAVLGTSMNSGKTTVAAAIVRGLRASGLQVAAGKVTGTGAGGDANLFIDSGAAPVLDFTDFGFASTYLLDRELVRAVFTSMIAELATAEPDVIVLEIADGIRQRETAALIADPVFVESVDRIVFAAAEALGAVAGNEMLAAAGLPVAVVSGKLTMSPLATREAQASIDVPVLTANELADQSARQVLLGDPVIECAGA